MSPSSRRVLGGVLLALVLLLSIDGVDSKGGGRVRSSSSSRSRSSSTRTRTSSRTRSPNGQYRAQPQSGCRTCYYNGATNTYYARNYYMFYGGHYYMCYSCGHQTTRPTCDPDACSCDEGSSCDPVDPNSMTMTVPAVTGTATVMLDPRKWTYDVTNMNSGEAFNFSLAFARDLAETLGVSQSGLSIVQTDTVAVKTITNSTTHPSLLAVLEELTTQQEKTVAIRDDANPWWIDITFTILVIDLMGTGSTTTPATMIQTLQDNCNSDAAAPGRHAAFYSYVLWGCLGNLEETTEVLQSQIGEATGDAGVITIGWTEIFMFLFSCIGCCYFCIKFSEWKEERAYAARRQERQAERQQQVEADSSNFASMPTATVDAVSVVTAVPVAEPAATIAQASWPSAPATVAVGTVVSGASASATPVESGDFNSASFEVEESSLPRQRSEPTALVGPHAKGGGDYGGAKQAGGGLPVRRNSALCPLPFPSLPRSRASFVLPILRLAQACIRSVVFAACRIRAACCQNAHHGPS
jgi:hypothetical protein